MILSLSALLSLLVVTGCGSPALTCQTQTCASGGKTYQLCVNIDASESYNFGGQSCHCSAASCQSCSQMIVAYCGGGAGGSGGSGGGGGGGSGGGTGSTCSITLSGALTGTFSCNAVTVFANASNLGGPTLTVSAPSPLQGLSITITRPGEPTSGIWTNGDAGSKSGLEAQASGTPPPTWDCSVGSGSDQGTYTMNLTVGAGTTTGNGKVYTASGTINATLPAINGTGAAGTVNVSASF